MTDRPLSPDILSSVTKRACQIDGHPAWVAISEHIHVCVRCAAQDTHYYTSRCCYRPDTREDHRCTRCLETTPYLCICGREKP